MRAAKRVGRSPLGGILVAQATLGALVSALLAGFDWVAGYSALLGALACALPSLYALAQSRRAGAPGAGGAASGTGLAWALRVEGGRIAVTLAICLGAFALVEPLNVLAFLGVLGGLQLLYALVPYLEARRLRGGNPGTSRPR